MPTLPNKLEADYTGTQPGDGPRRAGCTCGPPAPPPSSGGGPRPSIPRPAHPAREGGDWEAFLEKLKGSPSGHPASKARHQTPTSRRNQRSPTRVSSPFNWAEGGERGERAQGRAGERQAGLSARRAHRPRPKRPLLQLPKAEQSSGPEGTEVEA